MQIEQNNSKENQGAEYVDAKPAQKAEYYEDFTVLAERLRKEGRLDEKNYKKLRRKFWIANSGIALIMGLPIFLTMGKSNDFLIFLFFGGLGIWAVMNYRLDLNRYCHLFNLGSVAKGKIVEVNRYERNDSHIHYLISLGKNIKLNKDAMYNYYIVFSFKDKNDKLITLTQQDLKGLRPKKFYKVGDEVAVYYSLNNSNDAIVEPIEKVLNKKDYNLLLTSNN